jgi:hypothetical protein
MRQDKPGGGGPIGPLDWLKMLPFEPAASSHRLGWVGLQAARCREAPATRGQFSHHSERLVGVTPGQFGMPARIA